MPTNLPARFHDYTIESIFIYARERRLVLRAYDAHKITAPISVAEFSGLACYHFDGDILGTILFEIEPVDPATLYDQYSTALRRGYSSRGAHAPWVRDPEEARRFIAANAILGFEICASIGATGAIWCRAFQRWTETR